MCCCTGLTSCCGGGCGYCSECVGTAACNTMLCSSCITGDVFCTPVETPTPGSGTDIATNTSTSCCVVDVSACLPFAGTDENGNDIYQNSDGSLTYSDGSPASRADIACNCGACKGTPCSPKTCGTTDQAPHATASGGPMGGGSGAGSAKSSGGGTPSATPRAPASCASALTKAMSNLGASITSLLTGGKKTVAANTLPGQKSTSLLGVAMTPNTYLLTIFVIGALLLFLAFGHKPTAD